MTPATDLQLPEGQLLGVVEIRPGRFHLLIRCDRSHEGACRFPVWKKPATGTMWQWDGNRDTPTITPSIDCKGGCGRHWTIVAGVPQ